MLGVCHLLASSVEADFIFSRNNCFSVFGSGIISGNELRNEIRKAMKLVIPRNLEISGKLIPPHYQSKIVDFCKEKDFSQIILTALLNVICREKNIELLQKFFG